MAGQVGAEDIAVKTTFVPGKIEHKEAVYELIRTCNSLSNNAAFIINAGYAMAAILGETKAYKTEEGNFAVFNVFLKDSLTKKKEWKITTERPVSLKTWRFVNNAMRNLMTHQEVDPDEWTRRYDVLVTDGIKGNGTAAKRKVTINFWFSPGISSLERRITEKGEDFLEVVINMKLHRK